MMVVMNGKRGEKTREGAGTFTLGVIKQISFGKHPEPHSSPLPPPPPHDRRFPGLPPSLLYPRGSVPTPPLPLPVCRMYQPQSSRSRSTVHRCRSQQGHAHPHERSPPHYVDLKVDSLLYQIPEWDICSTGVPCNRKRICPKTHTRYLCSVPMFNTCTRCPHSMPILNIQPLERAPCIMPSF